MTLAALTGLPLLALLVACWVAMPLFAAAFLAAGRGPLWEPDATWVVRALEQRASRVDKPETGGTPRDAATYDQQLEKAARSVKVNQPRRKRI